MITMSCLITTVSGTARLMRLLETGLVGKILLLKKENVCYDLLE